jgi:ADP-heptose:LPS heptosyltransferase
LVRRIAAEIGQPARVVEAAGAVGIADLPALIAGLDLLISADTGVAHVAYATDTPSLTLFWRSDPARSGPLYHLDRHRVIARVPLCPPCHTRDCRYPDCANGITVDRVLDVARAMLSRSAGAGHARSVS